MVTNQEGIGWLTRGIKFKIAQLRYLRTISNRVCTSFFGKIGSLKGGSGVRPLILRFITNVLDVKHLLSTCLLLLLFACAQEPPQNDSWRPELIESEPKGSNRESIGFKRTPKGSQGEPRGSRRDTNGSHKRTNGLLKCIVKKSEKVAKRTLPGGGTK